MALYKGINFRTTAGHVTDGADETYCLEENYPVTRGGITFGYASGYYITSRDRNSSVDRRVAGKHTPSVDAVFRVDLPNAGTYRVTLAFHDTDYPETGQWSINDNTSSVYSTSSAAITTSQVYDTLGAAVTRSTWASSPSTTDIVFSSTVLKTNLSDISHIFLNEQSGGSPAPTASPKRIFPGIIR